MNLVTLDETTLAQGGASFYAYRDGQMAGPTSNRSYASLNRATGRHIIPGAINECIRNGMTDREQIIHVAARVSRCRRTTVAQLLDWLSGSNTKSNLWVEQDGLFDIASQAISEESSQPLAVIMD